MRKSPTIKAELWDQSTLCDVIELPDFVEIPRVLIIGDKYYHWQHDSSHEPHDLKARRYQLTTSYRVEDSIVI